MEDSYKGAQAGWTYGGLGGLIWIPVLGIVFIVQANYPAALTAVALFALGSLYLFRFAPWKHPDTPVGILYIGLPLLILLAAVSFLMLWELPPEYEHQLQVSGYAWMAILIPGASALFIPCFTFGRKSWTDLHGASTPASPPKPEPTSPSE